MQPRPSSTASHPSSGSPLQSRKPGWHATTAQLRVMHAPVAFGVQFLADRINRLQFLTIRRYLGVVFLTLILLLTVLAL